MGALQIDADPTLRRAAKPNGYSVLCVDDDPNVLALCNAALRRAGFEVDIVRSGWEALKLLNARRYSVVLLDLLMPSLHGRTVLSLIEQSHPDVLPRLIVITGLTDGAFDDLYGRIGGVLRKPLDLDALIDFVREFAETAATVAHPTA